MFLLDRIGFLGLLGLFSQAAMTWLFVGLFAVLLRDGNRPRYLRTWLGAFIALAIGLTLLCVRFFRAHDDSAMSTAAEWIDGQPIVSALYSGYLVAKVLFAQLLVRGATALAQRQRPRRLRALDLAILPTYAALPWFFGSVSTLLAAQVPMMVFYCAVAWVLLPSRGQPLRAGRRLVHMAVLGIAVSWLGHGLAALMTRHAHDAWGLWLAMNSHLDAALELLLGAGLIVTMLQDTHQRLHDSLREQDRLRTEALRDEKLRALGVLVSGVAHELNNPLTAILGFAEELEDPRDVTYAAKVIREQATRCRSIVRSLSSLAGECAHPRALIDCGELAERVVRGFEPQARAADVSLQLEVRNRASILADAMALEQVVANLIANAIQASPARGHVRVTVRADAANAIIDIDDEGPGVPDELRARLFEPFFTTKAPGQGTGLGLAVAFAIVRAHRGQLVADTTPTGHGARFRIRLPHAPATAEATPPTTSAVQRVARRRLLVVDDEPEIREVLRRHGEQRGWIVETAGSAEVALRILNRLSIDVVLCDVRMPGIGGKGLHQALCDNNPKLLPRCLFFTGETASPDVQAFARQLTGPLVTKPFDFGQLFSRAAELAGAA